MMALFMTDFDPKHGGLETLAQLERDYGELPKTPTVKTGGDGLHYCFRVPSVGIIIPTILVVLALLP